MATNDKVPSKRNGLERSAILLLTLGEQAAAEVMKHMSAKEVQRIGGAMAAMSAVTRDEVSTVINEFYVGVDNQTSVGVGADEYIRNVLVNALGEEKAGNIIDRILLGHSSKGLEALKWMDPRSIAEMIRQEHPQIISIVLAYLDSDQAAEVLAVFPDWLRVDVVMRIATLDGIQPSALSELDEILEKRFSGNGNNVKTSTLGGPKVAASIMNFMDGSQSTNVMTDITKADEQLANKIQDLMFVFDNLIDVDDRGMQELLRGVPGDKLLLALKGADDRLKEKFFSNMSQRAAEMLRDDLQSRGPVKLSDVEGAQKEILAVARRLADAGTINLGGGGEEYV
jgi:flagellar motor switch protein FliG